MTDCVQELLNYEGEAILYNMKIRDEIKNSLGREIDLDGELLFFQKNTYEAIYSDYINKKITYKDAAQSLGNYIGNRFAGNDETTYRDIYARQCPK